MATNVTQKDKTLKQVIDYCESWRSYTATYLQQAYWLDAGGKMWCDGLIQAYEKVIEYCKTMLGYSGAMPTEVPNRSEDAQ